MKQLSLSLAVLSVLLSTAAAQRTAPHPASVEIQVPGKTSVARVWSETSASGELERYYSVSLDGVSFSEPKRTDYELRLRYQRYDPLAETARVSPLLRARDDSRIAVVQYWTQGISDYREVLESLGVEVHLFLANHANVVELEPATVETVRALPFVRSVTPFHPAFKLEDELRQAVEEGRTGEVVVNLLTMRRRGHDPVVKWVESRGGVVDHVSEETYLMTARLGYHDLEGLAALDSVQWIDRWSPSSDDMNRARIMHGADHLFTELGMSGQGVRVEVMDSGCQLPHPDLSNWSRHGTVPVGAHGTCTSGIVVGTGANDAIATGCMPSAHLVSAAYPVGYQGGSRYNHTGQLVDPSRSYKCVLQTNSWGSGLTTSYSSISQDMDVILFDFEDISILQSQSNQGSRQSRPQAWAKNIISIGGISHFNTTQKSDDAWTSASYGPADDDRTKPDLASFYDSIYTTDITGGGGYANGNYTSGFGGTSGATPIVAGHLGLLYQMWHEDAFGNSPTGATVFESRPKNTTAKALLINTASQWNFSGTATNLRRVRQGWGHPHLVYAVNQRDRMLIVDETDVLDELDSTTYCVEVLSGQFHFRATMVYRDPGGTTSSSQHRINDLDLKVESPSGDVYWGNAGLRSATTSATGGSPNTVDTVENVILTNPEIGEWKVTVIASEVNADNHPEDGPENVDYALVISGAYPVAAAVPDAPSDLGVRTSARRAHVTFRDNSDDETGFEVERSTDGVNFALRGTTLPDQTRFVDTGLTSGQRYWYRARAVNGAGESAYSNVDDEKASKAELAPGF